MLELCCDVVFEAAVYLSMVVDFLYMGSFVGLQKALQLEFGLRGNVIIFLCRVFAEAGDDRGRLHNLKWLIGRTRSRRS